MKPTLTILLLVITQAVLAGKPRLPYYVAYDSVDLSVEEGYTLIEGIVYADGLLAANTLVSTCNSKIKTQTNEKGEFKFLISSKDSCLYAFKQWYTEVVTRPYDFKSRHRVKLVFSLIMDNTMIIEDKPVIYIYGKKGTKVELELQTKSELTFTYPKLDNNKWDVNLLENGNIKTTDVQYPYLFWEGKQKGLNFVSEDNRHFKNAYQIATDTCISFFENQLALLGLNFKERADFITYWGPRLIQSEFAQIQFLIDETYENNIATLKVIPKPNSVRRIFMLTRPAHKFDNSFLNTPIQIIPLKRNGLTIIEWGGSQLYPLKSTDI